MNLFLPRLVQTEGDNGFTFGHIETDEHEQLCVTLEESWRENQHNISCVPAGTYQGFIRKSHLHGGDGKRAYDVPELEDVPGRSHIQLHIGNTLADTEGCILLGQAYGRIDGKPAVLRSGLAYAKLMRRLEGVERFTLTITNAAA